MENKMKIITYKNKKWYIENEFLSGNGTYDLLMLELIGIESNHNIIVPAIDVEDYLDF
jgi:hypothetical protein